MAPVYILKTTIFLINCHILYIIIHSSCLRLFNHPDNSSPFIVMPSSLILLDIIFDG